MFHFKPEIEICMVFRSSIIGLLRDFSSIRSISLSCDTLQIVHALQDGSLFSISLNTSLKTIQNEHSDNFPAILREIEQMVKSIEFTLISTLNDGECPATARIYMLNTVVLFMQCIIQKTGKFRFYVGERPNSSGERMIRKTFQV